MPGTCSSGNACRHGDSLGSRTVWFNSFKCRVVWHVGQNEQPFISSCYAIPPFFSLKGNDFNSIVRTPYGTCLYLSPPSPPPSPSPSCLSVSSAYLASAIPAACLCARRVPDRPRVPANWAALPPLVSALSIPVIANGDVFQHKDFDAVRAATGTSSGCTVHGSRAGGRDQQWLQQTREAHCCSSCMMLTAAADL